MLLRRFLYMACYICVSLLSVLPQLVFMAVAPKLAARLPRLYHRLCLKIFHIKVVTEGDIAAQAPCLFVSNHASYLDIPVLGSLILGYFVAKSEVASWPLIGFLAKLQRTLFIDRRRSHVREGQSALSQRLIAGDNLILFPEGTSSDGCHILPFRRALFQAVLDHADEVDMLIQPVSVACVEMNGTAADREAKQTYAWFGDMSFVPHLWGFLKHKQTVVKVTFHPVINPKTWHNSADLAHFAEAMVAKGL